MTRPREPKVLILACGALARELHQVIALDDLRNITVECLPAILHNTPDEIVPTLEARLDRAEGRFDRVLIGYGDCGTGGRLDDLCLRRGVSRLPGAHCYEFYAGRRRFGDYHDAEPGTFYLTDYLASNVDRLVFDLLGIDEHPELLDVYFGHYRKLVYLAQSDSEMIRTKAITTADRLGLAYEEVATGYGELRTSVVQLARAS